MQPDNLPQGQPVAPDAPNSIVSGGNTTPHSVQPPDPQVSAQPPVEPNTTNYAATIFFTLLIVGFTFNLPSLLYIPVIFFCVGAGVLFFRDILATRKTAQAFQGQSSYYAASSSVPAKKRNPLVTLLLVTLGVIGTGIIMYIGFIVFFLIMLGASGV